LRSWRCSSAVRAGPRTKAFAPGWLAHAWIERSSHAASRRLTAASMNRRAGRALAHGQTADVQANTSHSLAAAAPPRQAPTRLSVAGLDGQRLMDRQVEAAASRRRWDEWLSSAAELRGQTLAMPGGSRIAGVRARVPDSLGRSPSVFALPLRRSVASASRQTTRTAVRLHSGPWEASVAQRDAIEFAGSSAGARC
jgi:hypothetical protein